MDSAANSMLPVMLLLGNPVRFFVTAGQSSDYIKALDLMIQDREMDALIELDKGL